MQIGRNKHLLVNAPKSQTCEECHSLMKRIAKVEVLGKPVATYRCKNKHILKISL